MASEQEPTSVLLRHQETLAKFGEFALRSEDLGEILHEACRLVSHALHTDLAKVMELQDDGITLKVRAGVGWPDGVVGVAQVKAEIGSSEGYALQTRDPVISPDIRTESRFDYPDFIKQAGVHALVNVNIIRPDNAPPYGLLQVDSRKPRDFSRQDTEFLRTYANLLAATVERLRVLNEIRAGSSALRESEVRLRRLLEALPQLVWRATAYDRWTWASPQWIDYTGLSDAASKGLGWKDALHPDDQPVARAAWQEAQAQGVLRFDCRIRHGGTGAYRWFQTRGTPLRDRDGETVEWIGTSTDIDDQVRAREVLARSGEQLEARVAERTAELEQALHALREQIAERERAEEQLRQSEKLKAVGQLTGGIAHDFNNMLQNIVSGVGLIRLRTRQSTAPDINRYLDSMDRAANRAATLTHRLLAFARQQTLSPQPVSLDRIACEMEEIVRRTVGPAVQVELKLADGKWLVLCDPNQMESAILNLCVNARDAMADGGWLTIGTAELEIGEAEAAAHEGARPGRYAAISVSDTGTGMPPEVLSRVFEPFYTTKPQGQGTGLGLSQIYGFVRQSGGFVDIQTAPGHGTTVRICLPFHENDDKTDTAMTTAAPKTLLLVEDEPDVRDMISETLRDRGYRVLEADSGAAAMRVMQAGAHLDLLVSDVGMPGGMSGREVAEAALERFPGLPVIIITGYAGGEPLSGMHVVRKPFEPAILADLVVAKLGG